MQQQLRAAQRPATQAVQENRTGGETNDPKGPENIANLNRASQGFLKGQTGNQAIFAGYGLIGTVWMKPNTYVTSTPNWQQLYLAEALEDKGTIPWAYVGRAAGYSASLVVAALSVALILFEDRELG